MSAPNRASSNNAESEFIEALRSRHEAEGFRFEVPPERSSLPSFFGSYVPDALAKKPGRNIAIEMKRHQSHEAQTQLQKIRRIFEGQADWQLHVVFMESGSLPSISIAVASPAAIERSVEEVKTLSRQGHQRSAFVMAWSLLEATLHSLVEHGEGKPRTPGTVVQTLAMNGFITPNVEENMRGLITLRNRIVHGDIEAEPSAEEVKVVLSAIADTLRTAA